MEQTNPGEQNPNFLRINEFSEAIEANRDSVANDEANDERKLIARPSIGDPDLRSDVEMSADPSEQNGVGDSELPQWLMVPR